MLVHVYAYRSALVPWVQAQMRKKSLAYIVPSKIQTNYAKGLVCATLYKAWEVEDNLGL